MTPEEMAVQQEQAAQARAIAASYLQSQDPNASYPGDVPVPEAAPPPPAPVPAGPPVGPKAGLVDRVVNQNIEGAKQVGGAIAKALPYAPAMMGGAGVLQAAGNAGTQKAVGETLGPPVEEKAPAGPEGPKTAATSPYEEPRLLPSAQRAGQPRMVSPGGLQTDSIQVSEHQGKPITAEMMAALPLWAQTQLIAANQENEAGKDQLNQKAFHLAEAQTVQDQANAQRAAIQADWKAKMAATQANVDTLNQQASAEIDPDKFWHDRGTFARVLGVIAAAFGGFSAGLTGGPNNASNIIENGINREIETQKANKANKAAAAGRAMNLYDAQRQHLGDDLAANEATKMGMLQSVQQMIDQEAARYGVAQTDARYTRLVGEIGKSYAEAQQGLADHSAADITKQTTIKNKPAVYASSPGESGKYDDHVITIPASDRTGNREMHVLVDEKAWKEAGDIQGVASAFHSLALDAANTRRQIQEAHAKGDRNAVRTYWQRLQSLETDRTKMVEKTRDPNSAVRGEEFAIEAAKGLNFTGGMHSVGGVLIQDKMSGDVTKNIEFADNHVQDQAASKLRGYTGQIVHQAVGLNKDGVPYTRWEPDGRLYDGRPVNSEKKNVAK